MIEKIQLYRAKCFSFLLKKISSVLKLGSKEKYFFLGQTLFSLFNCFLSSNFIFDHNFEMICTLWLESEFLTTPYG